MKRILLGCLLAVIATAAEAEVCLVNDPSGTPLNVRTKPNGTIIGALHNGIEVRILDQAYDSRGRPWALIDPADFGKRGWVYGPYLDCH